LKEKREKKERRIEVTVVETSIEVLAKTIHDLHGCKASWIKSIPVKETFQGKTVWEGEVQVFDLSDSSSTV